MSVKRVSANRVGPEMRAALKKVRTGIAMGTQRAALRGRAHMVRATPVDQGELRASWFVDATPGSRGVMTELNNKAPHAGIVEHGARPHPVSREGWESIYEWARRHFTGSGERDKDGRDKKLTGITWAIVKKIKTEGQKPTYFIKNELDTLGSFAAQEIQRVLAEIAARDSRPTPGAK